MPKHLQLCPKIFVFAKILRNFMVTELKSLKIVVTELIRGNRVDS